MIWAALIIGSIVAGILVVVVLWFREQSLFRQWLETLQQGTAQTVGSPVDFAALDELPLPVQRYFRHVLSDGQPVITQASLNQSGILRTSTKSEAWRPFTARQWVVPPARGFLWKARLAMPLATHLRIIDGYMRGTGFGRISWLSVFRLAAETGSPQLNAGELHRYLAEAVWFPTALLPRSGVVWQPIDEQTALATLTDNGTTVSLEFRFNSRGEVSGIFSPGRYGRFEGEYRPCPWEGHFKNYQRYGGMRVPGYGEVGWYVDGELQLVWKGQLVDVQYETAG